MLLLIWLAISSIAPSWAIHSSESGVVDWHKPLIGVPLNSASVAPAFHRISESVSNNGTVILTATASNVLAALTSSDGSIAWRYMFEENEHVIGYKRHGNVVAAVSGPGGAALRLLDATAGHLLVEKQLHRPEAGRMSDPETLGAAVVFAAEGDSNAVFVLSNAHVVRRINGETGQVEWDWTAPDQASLVAYSKIVATPSTVYLVGLAKSFASYTVHVAALSATTGEVLATAHVPSNIANGLTDLNVISNNHNPEVHPRVIWLESGSIRSFPLTPNLEEKGVMMKVAEYKKIHDIGLSEHGLFVAIMNDGRGRAVRIDTDGMQVIWTFKESTSSAQFTESMYSGGLDQNGLPYVARVFWVHSAKKAMVRIFAPHISLPEGQGVEWQVSLPFETSTYGVITHVAVEFADIPDHKVAVTRSFLSTSTGGIQLWQQNQLQWTREETLADIKLAELVDLPEKKVVTAHVGDEDETFGDRLMRQISDAQDFPQYAVNFARRFVTGSYASVSSSVATAADASEPFARDTFGFRKIIVAATSHGKLYGIDSANGEILWSRVFGLGWAAEVGGHIVPVKMFTLRTASDGDVPQVVLVTQRRASNGLVDTVLFHVNALTGEDLRNPAAPKDGLLQGFDVIAGPLVDAHFLRVGSVPLVLLLDEFVQVHVYPDTDETKEAYTRVLPSLQLPIRTGHPGHRHLKGHQISSEPEFTGKHVAQPSWSLSFPPSEEIVSITGRSREPVASLGKVLGNRTTLYKYLNPHLTAVVTGSAVPTATCSLYLIDGAKGTVLYHVVLPSADDGCDVKVVLTENWLIYHYYDGELAGTDSAKSYRVVSVELYEGSGIDSKKSSSDLSSLSKDMTAITVYDQAYVFPRGISAISATSTTYGITMKDIIVANENHQIQTFPRRFLDPRRPKRKPTNEEMEEWLIQYDSLIPDDPKRVLSHQYQVVGTKHIVTSPALLESTSLVFAYGQDLFFSRVAPSNTFDVLSEDFNKTQLVFTIAGLALAIIISKPMVRRKRLREKWYDQ